MSTEPDVASDDDRPGRVLAGLFLHQRAALRRPRPGGRIDGLGALDQAKNADDAGERSASPPDLSEEDDAG